MFKKYFLTGLVILLPLAVTAVILFFIINLLTAPFVGFFEHLFAGSSFYMHYQGVVHFLLQLFFLLALAAFTVMLGFLARLVAFKSLLSLYDYILHRTPVIKSIYKTAQQVIKTLLGGGSRSFQQVVLVPFPSSKSFCLGLVSGPAPQICRDATTDSLISVLIPTAPNPTSGFLILYDARDVIYIDMKVEDAMKCVLSCGVLSESATTAP